MLFSNTNYFLTSALISSHSEGNKGGEVINKSILQFIHLSRKVSFPGNSHQSIGCDILSVIHEFTLSSLVIVTVAVNSYSVTDVNRLNISTVSCHSSNNYSSSRQKDNSQESVVGCGCG